MKYIIYISLMLIMSVSLDAYEHGTIDTVISYRWGEGQNAGQSPEYFPQNIFGKPDSTASETIPASSPEDICSLGLGGQITVAFKGYEIVDGPGADFTIFENAFINPVTKKIFTEPGKVSVSYDGINFIEFPFDTLTFSGCAGRTPTHGDKDCFNPAESGGDTFDLSVLGIKRIRYIRITDVSYIIKNNPEHPLYDPTISGFDLDAVCGLYLEKTATFVHNYNENQILKVSTANGSIIINAELNGAAVSVIDLNGRAVARGLLRHYIRFDNLPAGVYIVLIRTDGKIIYRKKVLL